MNVEAFVAPSAGGQDHGKEVNMSKNGKQKPKREPIHVPKGKKLIFRPFITLKNGAKLWARQRGLRAFPIIVDT
jgi:hypothetical protein